MYERRNVDASVAMRELFGNPQLQLCGVLDDDWIVAGDVVARESGVDENTSAGTIVDTKKLIEDACRFIVWTHRAVVVTLFYPLIVAVDGFECGKCCERESRRTGANDIAESFMKGLFNEVVASSQEGKESPKPDKQEHEFRIDDAWYQ
jgi:hypothetical protein